MIPLWTDPAHYDWFYIYCFWMMNLHWVKAPACVFIERLIHFCVRLGIPVVLLLFFLPALVEQTPLLLLGALGRAVWSWTWAEGSICHGSVWLVRCVGRGDGASNANALVGDPLVLEEIQKKKKLRTMKIHLLNLSKCFHIVDTEVDKNQWIYFTD